MTTAPGDQPPPTHLQEPKAAHDRPSASGSLFPPVSGELQHGGGRAASHMPGSAPDALSERTGSPLAGARVFQLWLSRCETSPSFPAAAQGTEASLCVSVSCRVILLGNCGCSSELNNKIIARYNRYALYWRYKQGAMCQLVCQSVSNHQEIQKKRKRKLSKLCFQSTAPGSRLLWAAGIFMPSLVFSAL